MCIFFTLKNIKEITFFSYQFMIKAKDYSYYFIFYKKLLYLILNKLKYFHAIYSTKNIQAQISNRLLSLKF